MYRIILQKKKKLIFIQVQPLFNRHVMHIFLDKVSSMEQWTTRRRKKRKCQTCEFNSQKILPSHNSLRVIGKK